MDNNCTDLQLHCKEIFDMHYRRCKEILDILDDKYFFITDYQIELFPALYFVWDICIILFGLDRLKYTFPIFDHIINNGFFEDEDDKELFNRRVDLYEKISNDKQDLRGELFFCDTEQFEGEPVAKVIVAFSDILINPDCADNYDSAPLSVYDAFDIIEINKAFTELSKDIGEMMDEIYSLSKSQSMYDDEYYQKKALQMGVSVDVIKQLEAAERMANQDIKEQQKFIPANECAPKSAPSFWSNQKEKLMSKLGSISVVPLYVFNIIIAIIPIIVLKASFWWVIIAISFSITPIVGDLFILCFYIIGLTKVIGSPLTALVIIFYIALSIFVISRLIWIITSVIPSRE